MDYVSPISQCVVLLLLGAITKYSYDFITSHFKEAKADEWMLIMRNGEMRKAGIGLKEVIWPQETCITFPSRLQQVDFTAE